MKILDHELDTWYYCTSGEYACLRFKVRVRAPFQTAAFCIYHLNINNENKEVWHCDINGKLGLDEIFRKFHPDYYSVNTYSLSDLTKMVDQSIIKINKFKLFI